MTIRCRKPYRSCLASSISHLGNRRSTFLGVTSYGIQFPCLSIIPNDFKGCEIACLVTPDARASSSCVSHKSWSNNASNSASSYTFGLPLRSLSSMSNSPFLHFWNHSRQLISLKVVRADIVTLKSISSEMSSAIESRELHKVSPTFDLQHRGRVYYWIIQVPATCSHFIIFSALQSCHIFQLKMPNV